MVTDKETIFENVNPDDNSGEETTESRSLSESFKSRFVGEGKKYASEDEAFKGLHNANAHIGRLETENAELREQAAKAKTADELLAAIRERDTDSDDKVPPSNTVGVRAVVREELRASQEGNTRQTNILAASDKMKEVYGSEATVKLKEKAAELNMSIEDMMNVAAKSPSGFMTWFQPRADQQSQPTLQGDRKNLGDDSTSAKVGTYKHYQKMRKENPGLYNQPATQMEMHDNASKLGDSFYE